MPSITSVKDLQATCDKLYNFFVERLEQVTEVETIKRDFCNEVYLRIGEIKSNHLRIEKHSDDFISFWANGGNALLVGTCSDHDDIKIITYLNSEDKRYTNKNGQKTADLKKRAILLELKDKLEVLFKDYL